MFGKPRDRVAGERACEHTPVQRTGRSGETRPKFNRQLNGSAKGRVVMDYEMMKALMEANREQLAVPRKPELKEFPKPDSRPVWKYLDQGTKERIAA